MALTPCPQLPKMSTSEQVVGTIDINGSIYTRYEKCYTGSITISGTTQGSTLEAVSSLPNCILLDAIFKTPSNIFPNGIWTNDRRYTATYSNSVGGLSITYFDASSGNQGAGTYFVRVQYYK